jgi:citrate synthase
MSDAPGFKPKKSVALSGTAAGNTAICTVGKTGNDLHYRGYDILDVAEQCEFEEIAYLIVHEKLPTRAELAAYKDKLKSMRDIPQAVKTVLEQLPASTHPMDVMRTGCSALGCQTPEDADHNVEAARNIVDRLMACFGSMLVYWYHYSHNGKRIELVTDDDSARRTAARILGQGHARVADSLRRARTQRLYLYRARGCRHRLGHVLLHHRRHRSAARAQARRRQRGRLRNPVTL